MKDLIEDTKFEDTGFFSLRGDLDGEQLEDYTDAEQLIGLLVSKEEFLLPISDISEILILPTITYVPRSPEFIEGVINLRGTIVPTINLRKITCSEKGKNTLNTRVVVVKQQESLYGLIVDNITKVQAFTNSEIESKSLPLKNSTAEIITRISKKKNDIRGILNVERIIDYINNDDIDEENQSEAV